MNHGLSRMNSLSGLIGLVMAMALLAACSSNQNQGFGVLPSPSPNDATAPLPGASDQYLIQPGDRLSVNVLGQDQLSGEFPVEANGTVNLPSIGPVPATGRSVTDLQGELVGRYSATVADPQILVSILNASQ
jgi:polysaccharide export outer membrane protein